MRIGQLLHKECSVEKMLRQKLRAHESAEGKFKIWRGALLLILTPLYLFVKPAAGDALIRDLALMIWWDGKNQGQSLALCGTMILKLSPSTQ